MKDITTSALLASAAVRVGISAEAIIVGRNELERRARSWVVGELHRRQYSESEIARQLGVSLTSVDRILDRPRVKL